MVLRIVPFRNSLSLFDSFFSDVDFHLFEEQVTIFLQMILFPFVFLSMSRIAVCDLFVSLRVNKFRL